MKKIVLYVSILLLLAGCGKYTKNDIIDDFNNKVSKADSYFLKGSLEIYRNEELYTYDIESSYLKKDYFKVSLTNTTNNHNQIILKNKQGVYVVTPSLNKSFKFQSEWPYNNSQIYLLQPIATDLKSDKNVKLENKNNNYMLTFKANYINNKSLINQKIYLDKNLNLKKVEVLDSNEDVVMRLKIQKIDMNHKYKKSYFDLNNIISSDLETKNENTNNSSNDSSKNSNNENNNSEGTDKNSNTKTTSQINEVLFPMYVPVDTYLESQDVLSVDSGNRAILTFAGEKPFTIIQSSVSSNKTNYVYGEPYLIYDTVGAVTDNSLSWISNNREYYLTSTVMNVDELLLVAQSLNSVATGK